MKTTTSRMNAKERTFRNPFIHLSPILCLFAVVSSDAAEQDTAYFESTVLPLLKRRCYECHSHGKKIKGGLALDSRSGWEHGGDNGPALVPGDVEKSLLIKAVRYTDSDLQMPAKGKLPAEEIAILEQWVKQGAADPRDAGVAMKKRVIDIEEGRKFWAFQPVADPSLPTVKDAAWALDPADRFIMVNLERASMHPVANADRYTWLRRVSLDLTGLPPTPSQIEAFVSDHSPQAFEKVVDPLLNSKAFGERWARHWLDLTGYADMIGTSNSVFAEHAWRYRDYLINAFNADKPFDEFIREQVAGDLLPATSTEDRAENITATGFLLVGDIEIVNPDKPKMETDHIDTQVSKIGTAFMGMTLGCVRCHDHKFDPIGVDDYYGIAGMLRSTKSSAKIPFGVWSTLNTVELPETPAQIAERKQREAGYEQRVARLKADQTQWTASKDAIVAQLCKPDADKDALTKQRDEVTEKLKKRAAEIQHLEFFKPTVPKAFAVHDVEKPGDMPGYIRGNPYAPGAVVPRRVVRVASWDRMPAIPAGQSGRLQLADWLADKRNPLTARVAVNRIWQKLFGEGIVRSVDYFGARGELPSHPELLDHLATRFMRGGWSQKQFIRSLVLSRAYRMSSANDTVAMKTDPDNRLLWRMNRQRLDAEAIRDSMLAASGELTLNSGGPALVLEKVENTGALVQKGVNPPSYTHKTPRPSQEFERTVYLPVMRVGFAGPDRVRSFFDFADPALIAGQRNQTVVPTQSLFLLNNDLVRTRSKNLATSLLAELPNPGARLEALWLRVLNRPITNAERDDATAFLGEMETLITTGKDRPAFESIQWQELCHSLLASNGFVYRL